MHVTNQTIMAYAELSGDYNPIHIDEEYAKKTIFGGCIAHGGISASLISSVLGNDLPGPGCVFLKQELNYRKPVRAGDTITVCATITEIIPERRRLLLNTRVVNQNNDIIIDGTALMMLL